MTWLYELLLKLSMTAVQKIYKGDVEQVDVWFKNGKQVCLMSRDSAQQRKRVAENFRDEWTPEQVDRLKAAITSIRKDELNG